MGVYPTQVHVMRFGTLMKFAKVGNGNLSSKKLRVKVSTKKKGSSIRRDIKVARESADESWAVVV